MPERVHSLAASELLSRVFAREIAEGELEPLIGRGVRIGVNDARLSFAVGFDGRRFHPESGPVDLTVTGSVYDFLLLVTGREDPDTLFFHRHLAMEGDTALGVYVKNFLASVDPATLPLGHLLHPALQRCVELYERTA